MGNTPSFARTLRETNNVVLIQAGNVLEAISIITSGKGPAAIICEYHLPGKNAVYLYEYLRSCKVYDAVPFILLSSQFSPELLKLAQEKKMDDFYVMSAAVAEKIPGRVQFLVNYRKKAEEPIAVTSHGGVFKMPLSKRLFDIAVASTVLIIAAPFLLILMLAIRLESPGKVIYSQQRIGLGNRDFSIYKLRSMRFDQDCVVEQFAGEDDPRITRVGKIIRKLRIDELPQFYNVLRGEMSLIGPRPEQPSFVREFDEKIPFYSYRHVVKPGITGWAQVRQGYVANEDETRVKIEHDFYYIKHCSVMLDIYIVFLTVKTMLTGFGAR